jgi:hypothetical protein
LSVEQREAGSTQLSSREIDILYSWIEAGCKGPHGDINWYVDQAVRAVVDPDQRAELRNHLMNAVIKIQTFEPDQSTGKDDIGDLMGRALDVINRIVVESYAYSTETRH